MNKLEKCREILLKLSKTRRFWDSYIDEFINNFSELNKKEIKELSYLASAEIRYGFMRQLFGHVRREFNNFDDTEKRKVLNQLYLLVILENCDFDYRESILLVESFRQTTEKDSAMKVEEWSKVSHLASDKLKNTLRFY